MRGPLTPPPTAWAAVCLAHTLQELVAGFVMTNMCNPHCVKMCCMFSTVVCIPCAMASEKRRCETLMATNAARTRARFREFNARVSPPQPITMTRQCRDLMTFQATIYPHDHPMFAVSQRGDGPGESEKTPLLSPQTAEG